MKIKVAVPILLTTVFALVIVLPVWAQPPQVEFFEFPDVREIDCGSFTVLQEDIVSGRITTFFSSGGNATRFEAHVDIVGTVTHLGTGQSFKDHAALNFAGELPFDEISEAGVGVSWQLHLPRTGMVVLRAGRIVTDDSGIAIFSAGAGTDVPTYQFLCDQLANL